MTDSARGFSNDKLYKDLNVNYADNVNFFAGKEIIIEKEEVDEVKDQTSNDDLTEEQIAGVENLVKHFSLIKSNPIDEEIEGNEGIGSFAKNLLVSLWEFIKDIGRWIASLFTNKISRVETRVNFTEQKRKLNGIKEGEVKFPGSIRRLMIPTKVTQSPDWVYICAEEGIDFYNRVLNAHKDLKKRITQNVPITLENYKDDTVDDCLVKNIIKSGSGVKGVFKTDILPGNRVFVIRHPLRESPEAVITYFVDSELNNILRYKTFTPTTYLIESSLKVLKRYTDLIKQSQETSSKLQKEFEREVESFIKGRKEITPETRTYLRWLANTNKRLITGTFQHAVNVIEALDDFINAGLK